MNELTIKQLKTKIKNRTGRIAELQIEIKYLTKVLEQKMELEINQPIKSEAKPKPEIKYQKKEGVNDSGELKF